MLNLTRLFHSTLDQDRFDDVIAPATSRRGTLEEAKNVIRDHLRPRVREATVAVLGMNKAVEPRFRSQGSQRYKTCIDPAHLPPQEMDWDFGIYLPVSVWEDNGPPHSMAKLYFELIERLLDDLCRQRGWSLVPGKANCVRVQVATWGHVDVPLYAASEQEFERVYERAFAQAQLRKSDAQSVSFAQAGELVEHEWDELENIVMATRSGEWKPSDPEAVTRWFLDRVAEHGEQLRRACRYVKAWRDHQWPIGGPTSIAMMVAVAQSFRPQLRRDDLALEHAARILADKLGGPIREQAIDEGKENFNRLDERDSRDAAAKARLFAQQLQQARQLTVGQEPQALACAISQLGDRLPYRPDLIGADASAEHVRSVPARQVPPPLVPTTRAG